MPPVEEPPELKSILDAHAEFLMRKLSEVSRARSATQPKSSLMENLKSAFKRARNPIELVAFVSVQLIEGLRETIADKSITDEFYTEYAKKVDISRKPTDADLTEAGRKFAKFASDRGIKHPDLEASFVEFVRSQPQELQAFLGSQPREKLIIPEPQPDVGPRPARQKPQRRELWKDRQDRNESPVAFAARVYRAWMDEGVLARTDIKALDAELYGAINQWLTNNNQKQVPEPLPEGFRLLTKIEANDRWASLVQRGIIKIETASDANRLAGILNRREKSEGRQ